MFGKGTKKWPELVIFTSGHYSKFRDDKDEIL